MKTFVFITIIIFLTIATGAAQNNSEYDRTEIYGGYSLLKPTQGTIGLSEDSLFNGYEAAVTRNVHRLIGLKFASGGNFYGNQTGTQEQFTVKKSFYTFTGGVQIKNNKKQARLKPFGHALFGVGYFRNVFKNSICPACGQTSSFNTLVMTLGGGLDIRVNQRFSVRPVQVDYFYQGRDSGDIVRNFVRFGAGVNIHF